MFLSANNFFWKVERRGSLLRRTAQWRTLMRPEAGVLGAQYRGNDQGRAGRRTSCGEHPRASGSSRGRT